MNVIQLLEKRSQVTPEQTALIHGADRITFGQLEQRTRAVGAYFQGQGVQPGQRALLLVPLGVDFYVLLLGLLRIGAVVVLVDPTVGKEQAIQAVDAVEPDLFIGSPKAHLLRLTTAVVRRIPRKFTWRSWVPGSRTIRVGVPCNCSDYQSAADDPALITFTSGSTGRPKAICRTHGFLHEQHTVLCQTLPAPTGTIELNTLPVFILSSLAQGVTVVMPEQIGKPADQVDFAQVVGELVQHRVTRILAAPAFCQGMTNTLVAQQRTLPQIRQLYTGGGPVFPTLLAGLHERLPNAAITAVYGSTEAEPIAHIEHAAIQPSDQVAMQTGHGLLAGRPVDAIQLAILADGTGRPLHFATRQEFVAAQLPADCPGEIVVTGAHVQRGYLWGDDGLTKFSIDDTVWHRTGDAGYLDERGRLWLLGRCSAKLSDGDHTVYPFGIEAAAMAHCGVERAAVVEMKRERLLVIQAAAAIWETLEVELQTAATGLGIHRILRVAEIPVDTRHQSKVRYAALVKLLEDGEIDYVNSGA